MQVIIIYTMLTLPSVKIKIKIIIKINNKIKYINSPTRNSVNIILYRDYVSRNLY